MRFWMSRPLRLCHLCGYPIFGRYELIRSGSSNVPIHPEYVCAQTVPL